MADRNRGRGVRDRIQQDWLQRRAAGLSRAAGFRSQKHRRDANVFRPNDRCASTVHRGEKRLGRLSDAGRGRQNAQQRMHTYGGIPSYRWRRTLGATGAAGSGERTTRSIPARLCKTLIALVMRAVIAVLHSGKDITDLFLLLGREIELASQARDSAGRIRPWLQKRRRRLRARALHSAVSNGMAYRAQRNAQHKHKDDECQGLAIIGAKGHQISPPFSASNIKTSSASAGGAPGARLPAPLSPRALSPPPPPARAEPPHETHQTPT